MSLNFAPFPEITTERLNLKKIELYHAADMFLLRSDKNIMKYIPRPIAVTISDAENLIQKISAGIEKNESINWGIFIKNQTKLIGVIGFVRMQYENYRAEVGYLISREYQGQGYMNEALKSVIHYGFNSMKLHTIEAVIDPSNTSSEKLLLKNNFIKEGYFKENCFFEGEFLDSVYYTLINGEE